MTPFSLFLQDLVSADTLHALALTCKFSALALMISWALAQALSLVRFKSLTPILQFLLILPGFAYALMTLNLLRYMEVSQRYSMNSVLIAWVLASVPFLTLSFRQARADLDNRESELWQSLGAGPFTAWYHHEFRSSLPAQLAALLQQLWLYFASFSLVMILSGGPPQETLEVGIYNSVSLYQVNLTHAFALGFWQMVILIGLRGLWLNSKLSLKAGLQWGLVQETLRSSESKTSSKRVRYGCVASLLMAASLCLLSLKFAPHVGLMSALVISLSLASMVSAISILICLTLGQTRLRSLTEMGAWVSPMLLSLLFWKAFRFSLPPFLNAIFIQVILFTPWAARIILPLTARKRVSEIEMAEIMGGSPRFAWIAVEWPRIRKATLFAAGLVFSLSLTEVSSVLLFAQNGFTPLSVWVQNCFFRFRLNEAAFGTLILVYFSFLAVSKGRLFSRE